MSLQILIGRQPANLSTSLTQYMGPVLGNGSISTGETLVYTSVMAGVASKLRVKLSVAPGVGTTRSFTVMKAGVATGITLTISGTNVEGSDVVNTATFATDDTLSLRSSLTGTPAAAIAEWSLEWDTTTDGQSFYGEHVNTNLVGSGTSYRALFGGPRTTTVDSQFSVVAIAGAVTYLRINLTGNPGGVAGWTFNIRKNGVVQDGTGGTANTTIAIIGAVSTGSASFSMPISVGDRLDLVSVTAGAPAGWSMRHLVAVEADTPGEFMIPTSDGSSMSQSATNYALPAERITASAWSATESARQMAWLSDTPVVFTALAFRLSGVAGTAKSYTFGVGLNGVYGLADTVAGDVDLDGLGGGSSLTPAAGDLLSIRSVPAGTPSVRSAHYTIGVSEVIVPDTKVGVVVHGEDVDVKSTLTMAVNIDGVPRTVDQEGALCLGGRLILYEQGTAPAAVADAAVIYAEDNGSGKTRLMCRFQTGAVQQVAIEP